MATVKTSGLYQDGYYYNYNAGYQLAEFLNDESDAVGSALYVMGDVLGSLDTLGSDILGRVSVEGSDGLFSVTDEGKSAIGYDNGLYLQFTGSNLGALQPNGKGSATLTSLTVSGGGLGYSELTLNGKLVVNAKGVPSGSITSASFYDDYTGTTVDLGGKITVKGTIVEDVVSASYSAAFSTASIDDGNGNSVSLTGKFTVGEGGIEGAVSTLTFAQERTQLHVTGIKDLDLSDLLNDNFDFADILSGNDTITAAYTGKNYDGEEISATIEGFAGNDTLTGGVGDDTLFGGSGNDTLRGGDGDDTLFGDGSSYYSIGRVSKESIEKPITYNDTLVGGNGNDDLYGGLGNDRMSGGNGDDYYQVDSAKDVVTESAGKDSGYDIIELSVSEDFHVYKMAANVEEVYVGDNYYMPMGPMPIGPMPMDPIDTTITGNALNNYIVGGYGSDTLSGGAGNDVIMGDNDWWEGWGGDDILKGDAGSDALNGGYGENTLTGGAGADIFVHDVYSEFSDDTITDFKSGVDKLVLDFNRDMLSQYIDALGRSGTVTLSNSDYYSDSSVAEKLQSLVTLENFSLDAISVSESGIYFDSLDGEVWYVEYNDDDDSSSAHLMATLENTLLLSASDIVLVGGGEYYYD